MIVKSTLNIGNSSFEFQVDEKEPRDAMLTAIALGSARPFCDVCKEYGLETKTLNARKAKSKKDGKEYTFVSIRCKCGATSNLGEYVSGGYFWKEYEKYEAEDKETTPNRSEEELSIEDYSA